LNEAHLQAVEHAGNIGGVCGHYQPQRTVRRQIHVLRPERRARPSHAEDIAQDDECMGADEHAPKAEDPGVGEGAQHARGRRVGRHQAADPQ
jgi:hypothetical protein